MKFSGGQKREDPSIKAVTRRVLGFPLPAISCGVSRHHRTLCLAVQSKTHCFSVSSNKTH